MDKKDNVEPKSTLDGRRVPRSRYDTLMYPALEQNCIIAIATIANAGGNSVMLVRPIVMWAAIIRIAQARKTGRVGNFLRKRAANSPPGILAKETMKFM